MTFPVPTLQNDAPLKEHPFYQHLCENHTKQDMLFDMIESYLASLGFVKDVDIIDDAAFSDLLTVARSWEILAPWYKPKHVSDLFTWHGEQFYFHGSKERRGITPLLRQMLVDAGWIHPVEPATTYFEVIDGRLYAKYQQILGSRYLCDIVSEEQQ